MQVAIFNAAIICQFINGGQLSTRFPGTILPNLIWYPDGPVYFHPIYKMARQTGMAQTPPIFTTVHLKNVQRSSKNARGYILQSAHTVAWAPFLQCSLYNAH